MKKIYSLLIIALIFFTSCSDMLNQSPSGSLPTNEAITSVRDLQLAVNGAYYNIAYNRYSYVAEMQLYADAKGGDMTYMGTSNHLSPLMRYESDPTSNYIGLYRYPYLTISNLNLLKPIVEKPGFPIPDSEKAQFEDLKGQVYGLAAIMHFEVARMYAQLPTIAKDINAENSGIFLSKEAAELSVKTKRSTLQETYAYITEQLLLARGSLSKTRTIGHLNYWGATAMLSRVYLYMGNYSEAIKYADEVISSSGKEYRLMEIDEYTKQWADAKMCESLFEIKTDDNTNTGRYSIGYYTNPNGYTECFATPSFHTFMSANTDDIRSKMLKVYGTSSGANKQPWPMKYPGITGSVSLTYVNYPRVIRTAELYLIAAECSLYGAKGEHDGKWYYNTLRNNRITNNIEVNSYTIDNILDERRRELFCENHRMYDLVRHKRSLNLNESASLGTKAYDDNLILMPIPMRELEISKGSLKQNPGYQEANF
jgi:starch-binding outer membrane protein, SusD/RagB family